MTQVLEQPAVEPSVDTDELVVVVTHEDIEKGIQRNSVNCAVARAASRITGQGCQMGCRLSVGDQELYFNSQALDWIQLFDLDKTLVTPEWFRFKRVAPTR